MAYYFGVDIGGTTVKTGAFTEDGNRILYDFISTDRSDGGSHILPQIGDLIGRMAESLGITHAEIGGIGVTVPGAVDQARYANGCVNLGWGYVDVAGQIHELTGVRNVTVVNDANAAAAGEMWQGAGKGVKDLVMVALGTGVGAGIVLDGKIVPGAFGAAGEVGHIHVSDEVEETCGCGHKGCLEQFASATGIVRVAKQMLQEKSTPSVLRKEDVLTSKHVFDAADAGDELAKEVVDLVARILGTTLAQVSCVVDPKMYIIGGGVSLAGKTLLDPVQAYYRKAAFHASVDTVFTSAKLGGDAGHYGAAYAIISK